MCLPENYSLQTKPDVKLALMFVGLEFMLKCPPTNILEVPKRIVLLFTDYLKGVVCVSFCSVKNLVKKDTLTPKVAAFKSQKLSIICN